MIFHKFWAALRGQLNKLANLFWEKDPVAQMRYEYDLSVGQLKEGRKGLEMYRGMVERVARQVRAGEKHVAKLQARAKALLKAGDRGTASKFALELQHAKEQLDQNREQLATHEQAYENNLKKIQHANKKLVDLRQKIHRYDADLRMSEAEAEIARISQGFDMNITTDFGQIEQVIQQKIDRHRGAARVAADLTAKGLDEIATEERTEEALAEEALKDLEAELGLRAPETAPLPETKKDIGPAQPAVEEEQEN